MWTLERARSLANQPRTTPTDHDVRDLHRAMFAEVLPWAGQTRTKDVGPGMQLWFSWPQVPVQLRNFADDLSFFADSCSTPTQTSPPSPNIIADAHHRFQCMLYPLRRYERAHGARPGSSTSSGSRSGLSGLRSIPSPTDADESNYYDGLQAADARDPGPSRVVLPGPRDRRHRGIHEPRARGPAPSSLLEKGGARAQPMATFRNRTGEVIPSDPLAHQHVLPPGCPGRRALPLVPPHPRRSSPGGSCCWVCPSPRGPQRRSGQRAGRWGGRASGRHHPPDGQGTREGRRAPTPGAGDAAGRSPGGRGTEDGEEAAEQRERVGGLHQGSAVERRDHPGGEGACCPPDTTETRLASAEARCGAGLRSAGRAEASGVICGDAGEAA